MKKVLISILLFFSLTGFSNNLPDSVIMVVAGKPINLSEFLFIAQKNGEVNLKDKKSKEEYVELFKNFKLKVADAEAAGLDKKQTFKNELNVYQGQLLQSFLSDKKAEEAAAKVIYDRGEKTVELSHILFRLPEKTMTKDTVAVYQEAMKIYNRLQKGENLDTVGKALFEQDKEHIAYEYVHCLQPMQTIKAFEEAVYTLPIGQVSKPIRTKLGFHLILVHNRHPHPGLVQVSHILLAFPKDSTGHIVDKEGTLKRAKEVQQKIKAGEDFATVAKQYSDDKESSIKGGNLPEFGPGVMIEPFETAAFALQTPGEVSDIIETPFGYHIIKLIAKKERPSFEKVKVSLIQQMGQCEHNFDLYKAFDEKLKKEYGYHFYPEAYAELQALCNEDFPDQRSFFEKAKTMKKVLVHLDGTDFLQNDFAYYIQRCPFSTKTYAGDFMWEVYNLFIRDIITTSEQNNLLAKHPEYEHLVQEYRDGMLLFEISNLKIWNKPAAEQKQLEEAWIKELNQKYPVEINWKLIKKLGK